MCKHSLKSTEVNLTVLLHNVSSRAPPLQSTRVVTVAVVAKLDVCWYIICVAVQIPNREAIYYVWLGVLLIGLKGQLHVAHIITACRKSLINDRFSENF